MATKCSLWIPALVIAGICIALCGSVSAASPQLPCEFYGSVTLSGMPAPAGIVITAYVNGTPQGSIQVKQPGLYGGSGTFDERLIVMAGENDFAQGTPEITFRIDSQAADQKYSYQPGSSSVLNLSVGGGQPVIPPQAQQPSAPGNSGQTPVVVAQVSENTSVQSYSEPAQVSFPAGTTVTTTNITTSNQTG